MVDVLKSASPDILMDAENYIDGLSLLHQIRDCSISAAFLDPQYRGVLDKLAYGNEGSRQKGRSQLYQMTDETIAAFITELSRVVSPSGHLFLWVDKFHLCEGVGGWLHGSLFHIVDMITWDKKRMGMGYRSRRCCEYLLILQKQPLRAKGVWTDHGIPDVWSEKADGTHTHSKPIDLQERLIRAVTDVGDVVCDPCSGGFSVLKACLKSERHFIGTDLR